MILRFASRSEGKEGWGKCEGGFGKKKIPTSSNTLSLLPPQWLRHSCPMTHDASWDKTPLQKPVHKRPEQKIPKIIKNQPTNQQTHFWQEPFEKNSSNTNEDNTKLSYTKLQRRYLDTTTAVVVVLIRVWRWWAPRTTNMTCKTNSPVKS
jgi:hypothetical protein